MSYDLVLWRGTPLGGDALAWSHLAAGDPVAGLEPFTTDEVRTAFRAACRGDLEIDGDQLAGRGFSLTATDGALYLHVTCAWAMAADAAALRPIRDAARRLDATIFDPQTACAPQVPAQAIAAVPAWGPSVEIVAELPADRASSVAGMTLSTVPPDRGPLLDQVHELFLHEASTGIARGHSAHVANLAGTAATYARFATGILPFEVVVATLRGTTRDDSTTSTSRLLGIADGQLGILRAPRSTHANTDEGKPVTRWTAIGLFPGGRAHAPRGSALDLSPRLAFSGRAALAQAHAGDTLPLRRWIAAMVAIDADGRAAIEHEAPEVHEAGAVMKLWVQRAMAAMIVEARVRLPDRGGVAVEIEVLDRNAPCRVVPEPLGRT